MLHLTFSTTLAEQHRDELRGQADHWRLARSARADRRPPRPTARRWWRPATWPARA
jgi:hypothetical protein